MPLTNLTEVGITCWPCHQSKWTHHHNSCHTYTYQFILCLQKKWQSFISYTVKNCLICFIPNSK